MLIAVVGRAAIDPWRLDPSGIVPAVVDVSRVINDANDAIGCRGLYGVKAAVD
ncbi:hypothetical protein TIFTF001_029850 [Ficus carica]|uniref:Uncharacterized protein n=1 Tax=Ficus carica TaxID=3494 RepID=A0AA88DSP5_FICCA|nr:hypothetical protein TIFTF001_029850 [Ficus carica]